jgi:hypothetical protein
MSGTESLPVVSVPRPRGRPPAGEKARWRILYDAMAGLTPGDTFTYEQMAGLLDVDFRHATARGVMYAAARKAVEQLRQGEKKVFHIVRGQGYQFAPPEKVLEVARRHQARAVTEVEAGQQKIETIDLSRLDVTTARLFEATATAFARQASMMRRFDVRQTRLETAMAAVTATVETTIGHVAETTTRVAATEAEISQLRKRLAELESARLDPAGTPVFLPPTGT